MSKFVQLLCHYGLQKLSMDAHRDDIILESKRGRLDQKICDHAGARGGFVITSNDNTYLEPLLFRFKSTFSNMVPN